jgi:FKBP-type peptidyl-prolyl cis-trans isomerase SlyD
MEGLAIASDTVVTLSYALFDGKGEVVDHGDDPSEPVTYVHGYAQIVPGIERQIEGLRAGDKRSFTIASDEAFGDRDEEAVFEVDKADFPNPGSVEIGDEFTAEGEDGDMIPMRVVEIRPDGFLVDANHPLAGQTLRVDVAVAAVRAASEDEIARAQAALETALSGGCGCGHEHGHDDHDHADHEGHDHSGHDHSGHDHSGHDHRQPEGAGLIQIGKKS